MTDISYVFLVNSKYLQNGIFAVIIVLECLFPELFHKNKWYQSETNLLQLKLKVTMKAPSVVCPLILAEDGFTNIMITAKQPCFPCLRLLEMIGFAYVNAIIPSLSIKIATN